MSIVSQCLNIMSQLLVIVSAVWIFPNCCVSINQITFKTLFPFASHSVKFSLKKSIVK